MNKDKLRKDELPENTIKKIQNILRTNKIKVKKYKIKSIKNTIYSYRIELKDFYNLGVNGKGLSKKTAIASCYGELMERLQSGFLVYPKYLKKYNFSSEKKDSAIEFFTIKYIDCFFENTNNFEEFLKHAEEYHYVDNFINLNTKEQEKLPIKLINATTHTNGLCAGNTFEEAITQGICEILERYCYKKIFDEEIPLKNVIIPSNSSINGIIKKINTFGYHIKIKDCTLGKFPVIGVYLVNRQNNSYLFTVGSDVNINIAIQRCLTELFQGLSNKKNIDAKMKEIDNDFDNLDSKDKELNWIKCYSSNDGIHSPKIFKSNKEIPLDKLPFDNKINSNIDSLSFLLKILQINNYNIYIKQYNLLGFDTFKVYIPYLSEIDKIKEYEYNYLLNKKLIEKVFYNMDDSNYNEILLVQNCISNVMYNSKYKLMTIGKAFHSDNYIKTNYNNLSFEMFYVMLNLKINKDFTVDNNNLMQYLNLISSNDKYSYIIKNLKIILPSCPKCNKCKLNKNCKRKEWIIINQKINTK